MSVKKDSPIMPKTSDIYQAEVETEKAFRKVYFDEDSGRWYMQVNGGDWVDVPMDDGGLPMYEPMMPKKNKGK